MPDPDFDASDCLLRIERGDEGAARELMEHFYPFVVKLVRSHLPRRVSEEDLVQMIFIKVFHHLDSYAGKMPLEHWISRVAVNTCLNALKAEKIRPEYRLADFNEETAAHIERIAAAEDEIATEENARAAREVISELLARLSPEDRLLIHLLHIEERSVDEIHSRTGWSKSAIKVRAFRARAKMKKMLERTEGTDRL